MLLPIDRILSFLNKLTSFHPQQSLVMLYSPFLDCQLVRTLGAHPSFRSIWDPNVQLPRWLPVYYHLCHSGRTLVSFLIKKFPFHERDMKILVITTDPLINPSDMLYIYCIVYLLKSVTQVYSHLGLPCGDRPT